MKPNNKPQKNSINNLINIFEPSSSQKKSQSETQSSSTKNHIKSLDNSGLNREGEELDTDEEKDIEDISLDKNKITLNDLLSFSNSKNNANRNNMFGFRLKSLNKKSISFYNNFAFNELITNKNNSDKNTFQKNKQPQLDLYNAYSSNGRNSYANIKNKNRNFIKNQNGNKYHFSSEDKYKIKLGKPNNIYSENTNNNKNKKYLMNEFKGKKMIHNLTEDLLSENNRNDMPNIKTKSKINNMPNVKKLNFI